MYRPFDPPKFSTSKITTEGPKALGGASRGLGGRYVVSLVKHDINTLNSIIVDDGQHVLINNHNSYLF